MLNDLGMFSFNRKTTCAHDALMATKVPETMYVLGAVWMIAATLLRSH
jgi:hypothetical protein